MRSVAEQPESFDVVVVGGGSAGCVLAARLTEDPGTRVLLLEAGPSDQDWRIQMPSAVGTLLASDRYNWAYVSDPEPYLDGRRLSHPRGRVLGGSSSINGMVYVRGHALDYEAWAQTGLRGWGYADVLPYFKRAEGHALGADRYHGVAGPLSVSVPNLGASRLCRAFLAASSEAGYLVSRDVNGAQQEGFSRIDRTTRNGKRCSAAKAYLRPALGRPNLCVRTQALVCDVILDGRRATGIRYAWQGGAHVANARREVIVSGGALASPLLLQRSGIGDPDMLAAAGVATLHALPQVGRNLNDHPDIVIQHLSPLPTLYAATRGVRKLATGARWFLDGGGLAASNHFEAGGFIRSRAGVEQPDLQLTFMPLAVKPGTVEPVAGNAFQVHIDLMRPRSLGRVSIRTPDPAASPSILFNYLQDPRDLEDLRRAVALTREILAQDALAPFRGAEINPGPEIRDDSAVDAWIRGNVETCYHPVGTCRMGSGPHDSVVDGEGRVHGLAGLRVIDASIMPAIVSGNTNAPTIMIAEKLSDTITGRAPPAAEDAPVSLHPDWARAQR